MQKFKKFVLYTLISLITMFLLRLTLYLIYYKHFNSLNVYETIFSFLMGIRVDLITIWIPTSFLILLMFLPFKFTNNCNYNKILGYLWYFILSLIVLVLFSDIVYFNFTHRHISNEIKAMGNDMGFLVDMLIEYKFLVLIYILFITVLFFIFRKIILISIKLDKNSSYLTNFFIFFAVVLIVFLGIRSKLHGKAFGLSDAFALNKSASGNLALNGCYTLYKTISKNNKVYKFYDNKTALDTTKELLKNDVFKFTDKSYPLERTLKKRKNIKKYNIVIILLESWSSKYIDSFEKNNFNVTPNFDKLAKDGIIYRNFFANGQRSIIGITALLSGIPALKGIPFLGNGLELSNISYLGTIFKTNGYHTIAMQSSNRRSFRVDSIAKMAGFDEYYGAEDMPNIGDEDKNKLPKFGTWDGNMYALLLKKLDKIKKPFLSFAFTSSTHPPFISPGKKWELYPHNRKNIYGYLNTLKYADDKLGEFVKKARKKAWFNNTIFIFLADHTIGFGDDTQLLKNTNIKIKNRFLENMRIPLLIYAPKIFKHKIDDTISSQVDIMPTLIDFLGLNSNFSSLSNTLFHPTKNQFAFLNMGQTIAFVSKKGYIIHTLDKKLELFGDLLLEKKLLSLYQSITYLLKKNKWFKNYK